MRYIVSVYGHAFRRKYVCHAETRDDLQNVGVILVHYCQNANDARQFADIGAAEAVAFLTNGNVEEFAG